MIQKTDAILLKKQDLRETSLFLTFYTRSCGKIYGVMKGVRGQKGMYGSSPQLFSLSEIIFYERKTSEVFTISQYELKDFFAGIREGLEKTAYAVYFLELVNSLVPLCDVNEKMFDLLENGLHMLNSPASPKRVARIFEIKLLSLLGIMPQLKDCIICSGALDAKINFSLRNGGVICEKCSRKERDGFPVSTGTINFMEHINRSDWPMVLRIKVSQDVGEQVESLLKKFFDYHLHLRLKSLDFMRKTQMITDKE